MVRGCRALACGFVLTHKARVHIDIADPCHFVPAGSELDKEAFRRCESRYAMEGSFYSSLFPDDLATGAFRAIAVLQGLVDVLTGTQTC